MFLCISCTNESDEKMKVIHKDNPDFQTEEYRKIFLDGTHNTRELGGYETTDGKKVKWGVLYRSDKLSDLSTDDQEYLSSLGIKNVIDFRSSNEKSEDPDLIPDGMRYIQLPIEADGAIRPKVEAMMRGQDQGDLGELLVEANAEFVSKYKGVYKDFLETLANEQKPSLFHCTAGKDRAGFAAAITLLAVGVPMETVINDYMKTNEYTKEFVDDYLKKIKLYSLNQADVDQLRPIMGVEERFIIAAMDRIVEDYGSIENFIAEGLEIDDETLGKLKNFLLEES